MSAAWNVSVCEGQIVTEEPWMPRPTGEPDFGPAEFDRERTSWVDDILKHFLPMIDADPRITLYVEVGTDRGNWGIAQAWLVPRSVAARYAAENHGNAERIDPRLTSAAEGGPS